MEDRDLLRRLATGDREAIREFYRKFGDYMVAIALRRVKNRPDAGDVVHDLFQRWLERAPQFESVTNLRGFLIIVTDNATIDWIRRDREQRGLPPRSEEPPPPDRRRSGPMSVPRSGESKEQLQERVDEAMAKLTPTQRRMVETYFERGLTRQELMAIEGISENTLDQRIHAARVRLATELERAWERRHP